MKPDSRFALSAFRFPLQTLSFQVDTRIERWEIEGFIPSAVFASVVRRSPLVYEELMEVNRKSR